MKTIFLLTVILFAACTSNSQNAQVFQKEGIAINGYDAVGFFTESKPLKGSAQFNYSWNNAKWLFASQANLDSFQMAPERYAPQYGGYCAFGTAAGHKAPTEADTWTIIDGKLYFNYNKKVKEMWAAKPATYIEQANVKWEKIKDTE